MCSISFTDSCKIQHPQQQHTSLVIVITVLGCRASTYMCHHVIVLFWRPEHQVTVNFNGLPGKFLTLKFVNASLKDQQRCSFLVSCLAIEGTLRGSPAMKHHVHASVDALRNACAIMRVHIPNQKRVIPHRSS